VADENQKKPAIIPGCNLKKTAVSVRFVVETLLEERGGTVGNWRRIRANRFFD
jgi:hypothetical protein